MVNAADASVSIGEKNLSLDDQTSFLLLLSLALILLEFALPLSALEDRLLLPLFQSAETDLLRPLYMVHPLLPRTPVVSYLSSLQS